MKRMKAFMGRNAKETLRDPLNMVFTLAFPIFLILMLTFIQSKAPQAIFPIDRLAPGMAVFALAFTTLNTGFLISKDRKNSFLARLFTSPLTSSDFIWGYTLPQLAIAVGQIVICFGISMCVGLTPSWNILWAVLSLLPTALMFVAFGMWFGSVFTDNQVAGIISIFIQVAAFTSGLWFPLEIMGGVFRGICYALPFAHALDMAKGIMIGDFTEIFPHIWWVLGYTAATLFAAIYAFRKRMRG